VDCARAGTSWALLEDYIVLMFPALSGDWGGRPPDAGSAWRPIWR